MESINGTVIDENETVITVEEVEVSAVPPKTPKKKAPKKKEKKEEPTKKEETTKKVGGEKTKNKRLFSITKILKQDQEAVEPTSTGKYYSNTPAGAARKASNQVCKQASPRSH